MRYQDASNPGVASALRKDIRRGLVRKRQELKRRLQRIENIMRRLYGRTI